MGKPLSMDLRSQALTAVDEGMSCRSAAERFGVAPSTVIRWHDLRRRVGHFAPRRQGGDTRSRRIEGHRETIMTCYEEQRDITLDELRQELAGAGVTVAIWTLHRFFARHGITPKKRPPTPASVSVRAAPSGEKLPVGNRPILGRQVFILFFSIADIGAAATS